MAKAQPKKKAETQPTTRQASDPGPEWEQVGDHWDEMHTFETIGEVFEGIYLCSVNNVGPNESMVHIFDADQIRTGIWGSTVLDRRMDSVKLGHMARVTYLSNEVNPATGRTYKAFEVMQKKRPEKGFEHLTEQSVPF